MTESTENNLNKLIQRLKNADSKYANIVKGVQAIYWVLVPLYLILIVIHLFNNDPFTEVIGSACFLSGMLIFAFLMRYYYKTYSKVDYSLPTLQMLKKAAYRHKLFQWQALWALLAILFIDAGLVLNHTGDGNIWQTQIWFAPVLGLSFLVGVIWWYIQFKPLRDQALTLIAEIEGDD
ncbi:hypothetical protein [uncultured Draconibacterium sp.]|uniref:hypothetical protein n=1 Tax=uncultured Draconibacterium sp. TaxID=1573823 RepID=UPI0025D8D005|nr:hypothetical protein [uncultured Draconibacterium sp.]